MIRKKKSYGFAKLGVKLLKGKIVISFDIFTQSKFSTLIPEINNRRRDTETTNVKESSALSDSGFRPEDSGSRYVDSGSQTWILDPQTWIPDPYLWIPDPQTWIPDPYLWVGIPIRGFRVPRFGFPAIDSFT